MPQPGTRGFGWSGDWRMPWCFLTVTLEQAGSNQVLSEVWFFSFINQGYGPFEIELGKECEDWHCESISQQNAGQEMPN